MLYLIKSNTTSGEGNELTLTDDTNGITVTELTGGMNPTPQQLWVPCWIETAVLVLVNKGTGKLLHYNKAWEQADTAADEAANAVPAQGNDTPTCTMSMAGPGSRIFFRPNTNLDQNLNVLGNWPYKNNSPVGFWKWSRKEGGEDNETWQLVYYQAGL